MRDETIGELTLVEDRLWVVTRRTGLSVYDFDFASIFAVRHPSRLPGPVQAIARLGAVEDYPAVFELWRGRGVTFVNDPESSQLADDLSCWYAQLSDLTPRTFIFDSLPEVSSLNSALGFPMFLKGVRQTSHHDASLAIVRSAAEYEQLRERWANNAILASQRVAAREFVKLRIVRETQRVDELPRAFEFRTFWWHGKLVGEGPYWTDAGAYNWTTAERRDALAVANEAARRLGVALLCVDVAQRQDGQWIVVEVNDGQRSGYAGVSRIAMWRTLVDSFVS
jgi:hypothetical protein